LGNVGPSIVLFPVALVFLALFSMGFGLFVSVFNVFYRDVGYLVGIGMQLLFYATPIIYPITQVPEELWGGRIPAREIVSLNPLTQLVEWSRDAFYYLSWPSLASFAGTALSCTATFVVGWIVFNYKARNIAEEL
jgi:ABC-2 type transport system permease protein